mmetsp:Transcript_12393/g.23228  ORF Transcript_12393/g.23228 Transcript_12393/m.23228 type:complete len:292 (-) Transcript_12393:2093-2968(-)
MKSCARLLPVLVFCLKLTICQAFSGMCRGLAAPYFQVVPSCTTVARQPPSQPTWPFIQRTNRLISKSVHVTGVMRGVRSSLIDDAETYNYRGEGNSGFMKGVKPELNDRQIDRKRMAENKLHSSTEGKYMTLKVHPTESFKDFSNYSDPVNYDFDQNTNKNEDTSLSMSLLQSLWYLPVLTILSGISPACQIIAGSHTSRLPDTPIAHEVDTLLLWPAIGNPMDRGLPPTVFQTPAAAITDVSHYDVDWDAVSTAFLSNVATSMVYSCGIALFLYCFLFFGNNRSKSNISE